MIRAGESKFVGVMSSYHVRNSRWHVPALNDARRGVEVLQSSHCSQEHIPSSIFGHAHIVLDLDE